MNNSKIAGISAGVIVVSVLIGWMSTAPYLSNQGLGRLPGIIIGGTLTPALEDFSRLNQVSGPVVMKQSGFPPVVVHLSFVATEDGIITATRPDGGYWSQRVRDRGGDGFLRFGDETFAMEATEILDERRIPMMTQWATKAGRSMDEPLYEGSEPMREWEVFFWTPR